MRRWLVTTVTSSIWLWYGNASFDRAKQSGIYSWYKPAVLVSQICRTTARRQFCRSTNPRTGRGNSHSPLRFSYQTPTFNRKRYSARTCWEFQSVIRVMRRFRSPLRFVHWLFQHYWLFCKPFYSPRTELVSNLSLGFVRILKITSKFTVTFGDFSS